MNLADGIILFVVACYAWGGWAHGFMRNLFAGLGLVGGFVAGSALVPQLFEARTGDPIVALLAILTVVMCAVLGSALGSFIGRHFRGRDSLTQRVDAVFGVIFGVLVVLTASWALGYAMTAAPSSPFTDKVRESTILAKVDDVMPQQAATVLRGLSDSLTTEVFPRYLDPFQTEVITEVGPTDPAVLEIPGVRRAAPSVARVVGQAVCERVVSGSGVVYAPERILTNAHVVAGVREPEVTVDGERLKATTVVMDPALDLAVLAVPGLKARPLAFGDPAKSGDHAAVLGYPLGGPFHANAARIRDIMPLRSPDIRDEDRVVREVYSLRAEVRPGNSGGPLISPQGEILGIVFAASQTDAETGYALTAAQTQATAERGLRASKAVDTGACA